MKSKILFSVVVALGLMSGCSSPLAGTWVADATSKDVNPIASVTFAEDGTYTAGAKYHGVARATSGRWRMDNGTLILGSGADERRYGCSVEGDRVTLTHDETTSVMRRMKN